MATTAIKDIKLGTLITNLERISPYGAPGTWRVVALAERTPTITRLGLELVEAAPGDPKDVPLHTLELHPEVMVTVTGTKHELQRILELDGASLCSFDQRDMMNGVDRSTPFKGCLAVHVTSIPAFIASLCNTIKAYGQTLSSSTFADIGEVNFGHLERDNPDAHPLGTLVAYFPTIKFFVDPNRDG